MKTLRRFSGLLIVLYLLALTAYLLLRVVFGGDLWWLAMLNNFAPYFFLPLVVLALYALAVRLHPRFVLLPLILLVVGLVWFGPRFAPRPVAAPAEATLKLVSLNLWVHNQQLDLSEAWLRQQDADVVLLQEAYHDTAARLSDVYPYTQPNPALPDGQDRQILSRYPFVEAQWENGYVRSVIEVDGARVAIYNVHFGVPFVNEPRYGLASLPYPLSMIIRYNEAPRNEQIRAMLTRLESETLPAIVGGDFNTSDNSALYPVIAAQLTDSFREAASGFGATFPVGSKLPVALPIPPLMRIDYVWHTGGLRALEVEVGPEVGSDHRPVVAVLALPE